MESPFDIAADLDTPVSAFLKLEALDPRFLLESVCSAQQLGRFSFIGLGSAHELRLDEHHLTVDGERRPAPADRDELLATLRWALRRAPRLLPEIPGLPLPGGLVGVAGYDVVRRFERLPRLAAATDDEPQAAFVAPRSLLVFDHLTRRLAVLHAGSESERQALCGRVVEALRGPVPPPRPRRGVGAAVPSLTRDEFLAAVGRVKREITAGEVFQLVLSVRFEGSCDLDPFDVYRALRLSNPSPYLYFLRFDELAVVGSSPEALVQLQGRSASLCPIAGTRPRGEDAQADTALERELRLDPKEAAEHVMLVDLARNDLGRVAVPGTIEVEPYRSVERYSHVMHLVSGVQGQLEPGVDAFELFAATFPAGTVTGAPKVRAMELIEELEPVRRGLYAGTAGYFGSGGAMDQALAIRTLVLRDGQYSYQAGAGIVADSDPAHEYDEVLAKCAALRLALEDAGAIR